MAIPITQDNRHLKINTPAGKDVLLIERFTGYEEISKPFHFTVTLRAEVEAKSPAKVKPPQLLGHGMSVEMELADPKQKRFFHGLCRSFTIESQDSKFAYYQAELIPWFSLLDLEDDCRIFQDMTVPEIVDQIVGEFDFTAYLKKNLTRTYTKWDYCVQYRETTFNFISRILEDEGISYYFEHDQSKHVMVLADEGTEYATCAKPRFSPQKGVGEYEDTVDAFEKQQQLHPGKWVMRDYHFEMPAQTLQVENKAEQPDDATGNFTIFDYPGDYAKKFNKPKARLGDVPTEGETLVRNRMQREERDHILFHGSGHVRTFVTGQKFELNAKDPFKGTYLLSAVQHSIKQHPAYLANEDLDTAPYSNTFTCTPNWKSYSPARTTP
jgi:type VI secretion system secreted protein VgrG